MKEYVGKWFSKIIRRKKCKICENYKKKIKYEKKLIKKLEKNNKTVQVVIHKDKKNDMYMMQRVHLILSHEWDK